MTVDPELDAITIEEIAAQEFEDPWQRLMERAADVLRAHLQVDSLDLCKCGANLPPAYLGGMNAHLGPMIADFLSEAYRAGAVHVLTEAAGSVHRKRLYQGADVTTWLLQFAEQIRNGQSEEERNAAQRND